MITAGIICWCIAVVLTGAVYGTALHDGDVDKTCARIFLGAVVFGWLTLPAIVLGLPTLGAWYMWTVGFRLLWEGIQAAVHAPVALVKRAELGELVTRRKVEKSVGSLSIAPGEGGELSVKEDDHE